MLIDVHAHLGKWYFPAEQPSAADVAAYMQRESIQTTILSSSLGIIYDPAEGNRALAEAIAPFAQLRAYTAVNFNYMDLSFAQIQHYLGPQGNPQFVGIKVHPMLARHRYDTPEGLAITRKAAELGVPVLIHTFSSAIESPWNVLPAARACPDARLILAHMGGEMWLEGIRVAEQAPSVYLEVCSTYTDPEKIRMAIHAIGAERILFGTDSTLFDAAYMLGALEDAELSPAEMRLITYENACRLFGFPIEEK